VRWGSDVIPETGESGQPVLPCLGVSVPQHLEKRGGC
jgi:hypothetical protein